MKGDVPTGTYATKGDYLNGTLNESLQMERGARRLRVLSVLFDKERQEVSIGFIDETAGGQDRPTADYHLHINLPKSLIPTLVKVAEEEAPNP